MTKRFFSILFFLLVLDASASITEPVALFQNTARLYTESEYKFSDRQLLIYRDDLNRMDIEDILNLTSSDFIGLNDIHYFDNEKAHWVFFQITNSTNEIHDYILQGGRNAKETYHVLDENEKLTIKKTGYFFASSERDISENYQTRIRLRLEPSQTYKIYLKIESPDNLPVDVDLTLLPHNKWEINSVNKKLFQGVFTGVLLVIIVICLFFYFTRKNTVFLFISLYAACHLIYFGHVHGLFESLIFPNKANVIPPIWLIPFLTVASYFYFAREFVECKSYHPKWDNILKWVSRIGIMLFFLCSIYLIISNDYRTSTQIMFIYVLLASVATIAFLFQVNQDGNLISKYFIYGTTFLVFIVILAVLNQLIYYTSAIPLYVQIGVLIEVIIFSLGLSHKVKRDIDDHYITQRSLIIQFQQNEKMQKNVNQELEEQVADRTQKIKEQNLELEKARKTAEEAKQAKSDFLSVMSHEIRTPLNAIISLSHIMEMDNEDNSMEEYINALKFSAEGLHSLINDILDYNKIEAGKLRLENIEFSLIELLKNISETFKYKAHSKGIKLLIEIGEHTPDRLKGDPTRLTQIFNNLLSNAIKFTHEGHVLIKVYLKGIKDDTANIQFEVSDTGIGIPSEKVNAIFEEYEQADSSTTREYGGTGLGLSITQKLLKMMGSKIQVESSETSGSKFEFRIPFEINKTFTIVSHGDLDNTKNLKGCCVLVVDDNDMNRLVLRRLLSNWNTSFEEASDGEKAIELCQSQTFDLVLMDIEMKPLNGFETVEHIQQNMRGKRPPLFIAMSAYQPDDFDVKIQETAFATLISKPFDPEDLYERLVHHLSNNND